MSHLRTYYRLAGLRDAPLHHYRVSLALKAVSTTIRHNPDTKLPVTPAILKQVISHLPPGPLFLPVKLALLIMYMGFLRQSSVAPPTVKAFDSTRHLTWADITDTPKGLSLTLKWSKTIQKSQDAKRLLLPPTQDNTLCPVRTFRQLKASIGAPRLPSSPLLTFEDKRPITVRVVARIWTQAIKDAGLSPTAYSLHSLRRGGASYTYNDAKATLNDVMHQGTWRSAAVRAYIKPQEHSYNSVHHALMRI